MKRLLTTTAITAALLVTAMPARAGTTRPAETRSPEVLCKLVTQSGALSPTHIDRGSLRVTVLGDSWSVGSGLRHPRHLYPYWLARHMHADVHVVGAGSTGYTNPGPCGGLDYRERMTQVPRNTQLLVIEGGLNDGLMTKASQALPVVRAAKRRAPHARIVLLTSPTTPLIPDDMQNRINSAIRHAGAIAHVDVICVASWHIQISHDQIHPTHLGHRQFAKHLARVLRHRMKR